MGLSGPYNWTPSPFAPHAIQVFVLSPYHEVDIPLNEPEVLTSCNNEDLSPDLVELEKRPRCSLYISY